MKKIILSVVAVLAFGFTNAQDKKEVKNSHAVKFGIKGGANYDWLGTGDGLSVYDLRPEVGYHAGLVAEFKLSDKFSIQPEALYSVHSFNFNGNGNLDAKLEVTKIAVPVLGKYYFTKGLSLEVGPQVSYIIKADIEGDDIKDDLRSYDIAAVSGLAYDFNMGLFIQARYFYNFLDLGNDFKGNNHYGLQASLGYKF